jgi:hypothetical protein
LDKKKMRGIFVFLQDKRGTLQFHGICGGWILFQLKVWKNITNSMVVQRVRIFFPAKNQAMSSFFFFLEKEKKNSS